ncbi:MAG TPA: response regulator transcription factor [Anaerolineaceae bacterium]|nr:response regulator transcription factor [Anaerolineaceae bacterium]
MDHKIRIVIIDDHTLFREAVIEVLSKIDDFAVVGQGGTAKEAIYLTEHLKPDILLLDLGLPGGGLSAAWVLTSTFPETRIIALTSSAAEDDIIGAAKAGICAYVLKGVSGRDLINNIFKVHSGECLDFPTLEHHTGS